MKEHEQKKEILANQLIHQKDFLLSPISIEELLVTIQSNEKHRSWKTVEKVFNEILTKAIEEAKCQLQDKKKFILSSL